VAAKKGKRQVKSLKTLSLKGPKAAKTDIETSNDSAS
jgi:hypothetical protein